MTHMKFRRLYREEPLPLIVIGADVFLIWMASIVEESTLGHSKHKIQWPCRSWPSPSLK